MACRSYYWHDFGFIGDTLDTPGFGPFTYGLG